VLSGPRLPLGLRSGQLTRLPFGRWPATACALPMGHSGCPLSVSSRPCLSRASILDAARAPPNWRALVENRAFVGAFCRGRACTRDKWPGHVAPKPCGARRGFCRDVATPFVAGRNTARDKMSMPIYIEAASHPPPHFFLGGEGGGVC
jgi:hypothetical protein